MTRMIRFHKHGGPEVLEIENIDVTPPARGEIQIRVKALGVNRADLLMRAGKYIETPDLPSSLGLEAAGYIELVGEDVEGFAPGDAVSVVPPLSMARWPAYSELATFPAELVVKHPESINMETAAAIWMQYLTAYGALVDNAKLDRGEYIVITAASSSVGLAAIQIANMIGATPIAVTRTSAKRNALLELGAVHVIASEEEDLVARLMEISGGGGVRVVFDPIGGSIFEPLTRSMSYGGILIEYGGLSPEVTTLPLFTVLSKTLTIKGYLVHEIIKNSAKLEVAKQFILSGLKLGNLQPIIAKKFPFDQIVEAHKFIESNEHIGKVIVTL